MLKQHQSTYRVVCDEKGWSLIRDGRAEPLWRAHEKRDAVEYGRRVAGSNRPACLLVYGDDGAVESRCSFDL